MPKRMTDDEYRAENIRHWMEVAQIEHQRVLELEAEIAAMRPIVEAVATPRPKNACGLCTYPYASAHGKERRHTPDCPVEQARAYVAAHPVATSEGE